MQQCNTSKVLILIKTLRNACLAYYSEIESKFSHDLVHDERACSFLEAHILFTLYSYSSIFCSLLYLFSPFILCSPFPF